MVVLKLLKHKTLSFLKLFFIIFTPFYFISCSDDNTTPVTPPVEVTFLSFTNACPDSPNLDVYVNGFLAQSSIPFTGTMKYKNFVAGLNTVTVYSTGTTSDTLIDTTVFLTVNKYYSIFAIDSLQSIMPLFLNDDLTQPGSTNCNARFINLCPNGPSYDVQATTKTQPWFPDYSYGDYSTFRALTPGLYNINVLLQATPVIVTTVPNVALQQGYIYTFFTNGFVGTGGTPPNPGFTIITNYPFIN